MRKNVKVVGMGQRKMGTSAKTGRSYDFTPVAICFTADNFTGYQAATVNIQTEDVMHNSIAVDSVLDMVFHYNNGSIAVDAIL